MTKEEQQIFDYYIANQTRPNVVGIMDLARKFGIEAMVAHRIVGKGRDKQLKHYKKTGSWTQEKEVDNNGWLPIESAPKGVHVLVHYKDKDIVIGAQLEWIEPEYLDGHPLGEPFYDWVTDGEFILSCDFLPDYWKPMLELPKGPNDE